MSEIALINPCFEDIFGLSRIDCACFETNLYTESISTLYLDEAEGINLRVIDSLKNCDNANELFGIMDTARTSGINRFLSDVQIQLIQKYNLSRSNYTGTIGEQTFKNPKTSGYVYSGVRFYTANVVGGYMKIKNIKTIFQASGTFNLLVYNNMNELLHTIPLATTAGGVTNNTQDITLPLWDERTQYLEYIFVYVYNPANPPKDNQLHCNCGGVRYDFHTQYPYFHSKSNKMKGWSKWLMIGQLETNNLDFDDLPTTTGNYMNGLTFDIEMWCDLTKQFCFDEPKLTDRQFISVAFTVRHAASYYLCTHLLTTPNLNRYTMINHEQMAALRNIHEEKYKEVLGFLVDTTDISNTDCLVCKDNIRIGKGLIG